ncbi:MBL fold metallo-hydrolase [Actinopolymorpha cephalotaxi]|uniref:Glyoxylase-like metal-dependent hydrolase (Beta-lactamase superfamily II) n=1 Tax=Actinopolymorpha cephalotaxi TaxID=504797 RepID=A0ABX2S987_9ACTN|nr:MBL fold metallo-hydrolase [Actinopolymorpha cephalotaxi]NYH86214.1 glyoxylase-like metal-dependent hydrolase (beta-lactamase superfamily II) [Actinopolymorpha cephalotaxi]
MAKRIDFLDGAPIEGAPEPAWIHGALSNRLTTDPLIQVHAHDPHTYVLRQSKATSYEAPFVFLLLGNERALLLDTGATADPEKFPLRATVDGIIDDWLSEHAGHARDSYELVVAHTHGHGDHVAGDPQFAGRPHTTTVGVEVAAVQAYFGFSDWPEQIVRFDLGGRVLEITGCPGHHAASIAVYDRWSGFLFTGDTVYPGRLYVKDFPAFVASLDRLVDLAAERPVTRVLGCHIEMTRRPGRDYPAGSTYQPDEPPLAMTVAQLTAVRDAAHEVADRPGVHRRDDFIIWNGVTLRPQLVQVARLCAERLRNGIRHRSTRSPTP